MSRRRLKALLYPAGIHIHFGLIRRNMDTKHLTLKELPEAERPYERFLSFGPSALSDAELLAVIIRTGCAGKTSIDIARELLTGVDGSYSLINLYDKSIKEMNRIAGIGTVKAIMLKCVAELAGRLSITMHKDRLRLKDPKSVAAMYMEVMRHLDHEQTRVIFTDGADGFICDEVMTRGTVNCAPVSPREIFIKALEYRAVGIILLHNHPSGDPTPSHEDILITDKLKEAGSLIDIRLLDHLIIGDGRFVSMNTMGYL